MATFYVDFVAGNDANAGTQAAPWKNASKINSDTIAGDTILLQGGVTLTTDAAVTLKPTQTLGRYGTGYPIIDGHDTHNCILMTALTGVTIQNIRCINTVNAEPTGSVNCILTATSVGTLTMNDVQTYGGFVGFNIPTGVSGSGNVFTGCLFERAWSDNVDINGSAVITLNWCTLKDAGNGAAALGSEDNISAHQTGTFTCNDCFFISGRRGPGLSVHTAGTCTFNRCFVKTDSSTDGNGRYVFGLDGTGTMVIENCVIIIEGTTQQFVFRARNGGIMTVTNNTIIVTNTSVAASAVFLATGGSSSVMTCKNNTVYAQSGSNTKLADDVTYPVVALVANDNCYFPDGAAKFYLAGVAQASFAVWQVTHDASSLATNPLIYNGLTPTSPADARLTSASPCIASGEAGLVTKDFHGRDRLPVGGNSDMGAIQYKQGYKGA